MEAGKPASQARSHTPAPAAAGTGATGSGGAAGVGKPLQSARTAGKSNTATAASKSTDKAGKNTTAGKLKSPDTGTEPPKGKKTFTLVSLKDRLDKMEGTMSQMGTLLARVAEALPPRDNINSSAAASSSSSSTQPRGPTRAIMDDNTSSQNTANLQANSGTPDIPPIPIGLQDYYGDPADTAGEAFSDIEGDTEGDVIQQDSIEIPAIAAKFAVASDIGEPIDDNVAQSTAYLMTHQLEQKALDEVAEKYPAPNNCSLIETPKVNPNVWDILPHNTKSRDLKLQRVQKSLTKGLNAYVRTLSSDEMTEVQQDALALICNANFELNCLRKELLKPDLDPRVRHLCKPSVPATRLLFGDNLNKQVKDMREDQVTAAGIVKGQGKRKPYRFSPYTNTHKAWGSQPAPTTYRQWDYKASSGTPSGPFLGHRNKWNKKPPPHTQTLSSQKRTTPSAQRGAFQRRK